MTLLDKCFEIGSLRDGKAVFTFLLVKIGIIGASLSDNRLKNVIVSSERYCMKKSCLSFICSSKLVSKKISGTLRMPSPCY